MNEILLWTLIVIAVGLTIQFAMLSLRHENLLREHTRAIRELVSKGERDEPWDFTEKVKGIYKYVQIIAWIGVFFCVCVCLHYLCGYCPREKTLVETDYMGIIVGILSAIITLLVGWTIYSTIKAKEELREARNDIEKRFSKRLDEFDKCCEKRGEQIKALEDCCKKRKKEIENLVDAVNESLGKTLMIAENHFAEIYKNLILGETELGYEYLFLSYRIQALGDAAKIGEIKGCNLIVSDIMQTLNKIWPVTMTARSKKDLIDDLLEVDSPDKIVGYDDLRKALSKIKTNPNVKGL